MKKFVLCVLALLIGFNIYGCKAYDEKNQDKSNVEKSFDIKAAKNIVESYMNDLMNGDYENLKKLYTKELLENDVVDETQSLKIKGYLISEFNEIGKSGLFKIKVSRVNTSKPYVSLDEYSIKVSQENLDYKISEVNNTVQKEAFSKLDQIRIKIKNNADTNLLIKKDSIPGYVFSKDDKSKVNKIFVPKQNFGPMTFSFEGDSLAISTYDKDSFAAIVKIDESLAVQGEEDSGGGSGSASGGQEGGAAESNIKEKPIGKEVINLDLIRESKIEFMAFSQDQNNIVIQYSHGKDNKCIRVYQTDNGEIIPYMFEKNYPIDKVDIVFSSFDNQKMNYEVIAKENSDKSVGEFIGRWQIDLKSFKVEKM